MCVLWVAEIKYVCVYFGEIILPHSHPHICRSGSQSHHSPLKYHRSTDGRCPNSMQSSVYVTVECPSERLSVCPVNRQQQRRAAGLLLSSPLAGDIN